MYYKKCLVLLLTSGVFATSVLSMPTAQDIERWTPPRLHTKEGAVQTIQRFMEEEEPSVILKDVSANGRDYGYNFPAVTPIHEACLLEVNRRYMTDGKRPLVLDLGAGNGSMTWKMIVAGGFVYAIEGQRASAQQMQQKVQKVIPFLAPGETMKAAYLGRVGDVLNFESLAYQRTYDITWSGNLIHLMTPNQVRGYLANLYNITAPGGYAFATVNAPCSIPGLAAFYEERQSMGEEFPGHVLVNKTIYCYIKGMLTDEPGSSYYYDPTEGRDIRVELTEQSNIGVELNGPIVRATDDLLPNVAMHGYHNEPPVTEVQYDLHERLIPEPPFTVSDILKRKTHSAMHFFDTSVFRRVFEEAGFVVEDVFYINVQLQRREDNLSFIDLADGQYTLGLKAKKPDLR